MTDFMNDIFNALSGEDFEEIPVTIEEFVTSEDYLNLPPLSELQYKMIRAGSQIYRYETLVSLYGEDVADKRYKETFNEIILQLGKGSGKDYTSTIVCCYVVYLLLCLKDPAKYYGKPAEDTIDIVNIAVNSDQARNVFFANFVKRVKTCPWFIGKYDDKTNSIEFDKSVRVFSGHSQREAFEGLNLFLAVLDEISAFALESNTGNDRADTAQATYDMYRASVDSRFADFGKVYLLSFPRFENDYIQQRYNAVIAEKEVIIRTHKFTLDPDLPSDHPDWVNNTFEIQWEEDHIIRYEYPRIFALKRPTWEVNPTVNIDSPAMVRQFHSNLADALGRFACMPTTDKDNIFFKNQASIASSFVTRNGVDDNGIFLDSFLPDAGKKYFIHVDLAQKHDHAAVAIAHVDGWQNIEIGVAGYKELHPIVVVDAIRYWTPTKDKSVDFADVRNYIVALNRKGFNIKLCTFDRWNSHDTMNILEKEYGIKTDTLSVAKKHYDDWLSVMYDGRLVGPKVQLLIDELAELMDLKGKIEHPRKGSKDLSDAVCGAIFNAVSLTPKPVNKVVETVSYKQIMQQRRLEIEARRKEEADGVIKAPKREVPAELRSYLDSISLI